MQVAEHSQTSGCVPFGHTPIEIDHDGIEILPLGPTKAFVGIAGDLNLVASEIAFESGQIARFIIPSWYVGPVIYP